MTRILPSHPSRAALRANAAFCQYASLVEPFVLYYAARVPALRPARSRTLVWRRGQ
jgi:hypothetical protein